MKTKNLTEKLAARLDAAGDRYELLAKEKALDSIHKAGAGLIITPLDARLIRDHEIRAETFRAARALIAE